MTIMLAMIKRSGSWGQSWKLTAIFLAEDLTMVYAPSLPFKLQVVYWSMSVERSFCQTNLRSCCYVRNDVEFVKIRAIFTWSGKSMDCFERNNPLSAFVGRRNQNIHTVVSHEDWSQLCTCCGAFSFHYFCYALPLPEEAGKAGQADDRKSRISI